MDQYLSVVRCIIYLVNLGIRILGLNLEHPVLNASGILGSEPEHVDILVKHGFSCIVTKTITLEPREGYPPPILIELDNGGYLNAVGLANPGVRGICPMVERARLLGRPIIVSVGGGDLREYVEVSIKAEECGASGVELNLSCPNVRGFGLELGADPSMVYRVVRDVVSVLKIPVLAKLGFGDRVIESSGRALEAGAAGLTLINTIKAMYIDVYSARPVLSNKYGGLSGPPIRPIAIRVVYDVYREYRALIIGCGGVSSWRDAAEFILAGARVVQVGSGFLRNRWIVRDILAGLRKWLEVLGVESIEELVGFAHRS
jgi:dihydroorotate dehydrogenase (NAD+) catalytic subunit